MLERIAAGMIRHGMVAPGLRIGVAVSGGADSVCLLDVLSALAPRWDLRLHVLHLNHCLRGAESDEDEAFVRRLAEGRRLPCTVERQDVGRRAGEAHENLEQAARRARREFLLGFVRRGELDRIALGHTRSDQAETVLFRFLRGAGTAGLAGMRPAPPDGLIRPLLDVTRAEVLEYLREREIPWREDSSNAQRIFARNRIRLDLLPELVRDWNPALPDALAGLARMAADEEDYWEREVDRTVAGHLVEKPPAVLFRTDWFRSLPPALGRRVLRRAISRAKGNLRAIDLAHVERILELTESSEGSGRLQVPGLDVFRSFDWMRLAPPGMDRPEDRDFELPMTAPGQVTLPGGAGTLSLEVGPGSVSGIALPDADTGYNGYVTELDWGRLSGDLLVRNWRPGDQYRPVGHSRDIKLKLLFQQARIPLWERRRWPVMLCHHAIVWAGRFGPAAEFAATPESRPVLKVRHLGNSTDF